MSFNRLTLNIFVEGRANTFYYETKQWHEQAKTKGYIGENRFIVDSIDYTQDEMGTHILCTQGKLQSTINLSPSVPHIVWTEPLEREE